MSVFSTSFNTSKFDASEYTYIKTTKLNALESDLNRAQQANARLVDEANVLAATLERADAEINAQRDRIADLRNNLWECEYQYEELYRENVSREQYEEMRAEWQQLCEEWDQLETENKRLRKELAARNSPTTTQGTQTINNEYRVSVSHI